MKTKTKIKTLLTFFLVLCATHAHATLMINPSSSIMSGNENNVPAIEFTINLTYPGLDVLYKADVENPVEEDGPFLTSYETTFSDTINTPTNDLDPDTALLSYVVGNTITNYTDLYLLVKDGDQQPAWYLFDINSWDGTESIEMTNFWPLKGAISHVAIYGNSTPIPEPATMLLFGSGLVGLAGRKLRKKKK